MIGCVDDVDDDDDDDDDDEYLRQKTIQIIGRSNFLQCVYAHVG